MNIIESSFEGLNGMKIYYQICLPEKPKALVQIIHGGFEHTRRYKRVIEKLVSEKYLVFINDHRGHGKSQGKRNHITSFSEYAEDCYTLAQIIKKDHGNLPFFLLGHSMGSFVAQRYALDHQDELIGLILSGTGTGSYPLSKFMEKLARIMAKIVPSFSNLLKTIPQIL
jgi:lysophospholipase